MESFRRLRDWGAQFIDYRAAWMAALFLGAIVWLINLSHGPLAALPAAVKQASYTFFVAGFIMRLCERLSVQIARTWLALFLAVLLPGSIAVGLTFLMHSLKGTPEPLYSTLPTLLLAPPSMFVWGKRSRARELNSQPAAACSPRC
jgi:hypothetical protein